MLCRLKIASFTHFSVYRQNNFPCSCYFLLQTTTISPAWGVKKSPSSIRKLHPFPLTAFAYYLASHSWPSADRSSFAQEWQRQGKCVLHRGVSTCFAPTRCFPLLPAGVHKNQTQWAQHAHFSTGGLKFRGLKNQFGIKNAS